MPGVGKADFAPARLVYGRNRSRVDGSEREVVILPVEVIEERSRLGFILEAMQ